MDDYYKSQNDININESMLSELGGKSGNRNDNKNYIDLKELAYDEKFYTDVYNYYYEGGFYNILATHIGEITSSIFGILFFIFTFCLLDWSKILLCGREKDVKDCGDLFDYLKFDTPNFFIICCLILATTTTLYKIISFIFNLKKLIRIKNFFYNKLHFTHKDLQTIPWKDAIIKISELTTLSIKEITYIILQKENYLISIINNNILQIPQFMYTKQLEMNLERIIFKDMKNIDKLDHRKLRNRFILYGIFNIIFSIFIFIFIFIYFFISNIDEINSNKSILGGRNYNLYAKRKFRQYNELRHFFEKRLNKSYKYALEYIKQFPSTFFENVGKYLGLITGSFIGFFLILSILDENILLYVRLFNRSLLFYAGIISAISATSRGFIRSPENSIYNTQAVMEKIISYTYYMPSHWTGRLNTYDIRDEFLSFFNYKTIIFLYDLVSVITTPFILIFILSKKSKKIVIFLHENTIYVKNVGNICNFSDFRSKYIDSDEKLIKSLSVFSENHSEANLEELKLF